MIVLWIILGVLIAILAVLLLFLFFGKARIKIRVKDTVKIVFSVGGVRFWLYPLRYDTAESPGEKKWIRKQIGKRRRQKKINEAKKAAGKPVPNMLDNLQMVVALIRRAQEHVQGRLRISVRSFHLQVAAGDAAQTAILYGAVVGVTSSILQWIHTQFAPIDRREGSISVTPDYVTGQSLADVDIVLETSLIRALGILFRMFDAYNEEHDRAIFKATRRLEAKQAREKRRILAKENKAAKANAREAS